ncbi:hypothetical protein AGMMS49938_12180 [Fibrobacterales bacterium]|nr:hypothetical protein AGMMS49938_12180 [Fibrobacterales bacterium]
MLTWISENAKWVIYIFIAGIAAGLLFMDMSSLQIDKRPPVGVVNGEKLSNDLFDARLRQIQSQQSGLSDAQAMQLREELFKSFVQQHLLQKEISKAKITASVYEMSRDLRTDPPQGIDREPTFQTEGRFDPEKYEAWLNDPNTYNIPFMQEYETMLRDAKIPEKQLRVFVGAGVHPSSLEAKFNVLHRETKYKVWNAQGNPRAFAEEDVSAAAIDSVFAANLDSFYVADDLSKVNYVSIAVLPSKADEEGTFEYAKLLISQIKDGSDFADIARNSSEDAGSAVQGGDLGDWTGHGKWVAEFDSAAFALDSGEISDPVRTQFGYHIIQNLGKRGVGDSVEVKARHILLNVTASAETIDSLENILGDLKNAVDEGKSFADAATAKGLKVATSTWFKRGGEIPELGYVSGLSSYAFFNPLRPKEDSKVSEILQNQKWVVLFEKNATLSAGKRDLEFYKDKITANLKAVRRVQKIADYLKSRSAQFDTISVLDSVSAVSVENAVIDSATVAGEGYLPGLGYASAELYGALAKAKYNEWSGPFSGAQTAVLLKVLGKINPDPSTVSAAIHDELETAWQYGAFSVFGDYSRDLEQSANVVNNLDLYYKE